MDGALWIAFGVLFCAFGVIIAGALRFRALRRRIGSFDCGLRRMPDGVWVQGIAHYAVGRIDWWRAHALSLRPRRTWSRQGFVIVGRQDASDGISCIVQCVCSGEELTLWMRKDAYAGLASWLEAAPPQSRLVL